MHYFIIVFALLIKLSEMFTLNSNISPNNELEIISNKLKDGIKSITYDLHTIDSKKGMDCLKINYENTKTPFGVFHSGNSTTHYTQLYFSQQMVENDETKWWITVKLSERGSQGTIFAIPEGGYLIGYQLENHEHGNTIAIRYYQNQEKLKVNNFLYQYQLNQIVSEKNVKNIGTPSLEKISIVTKQNETKYNQYLLQFKFHYSPDGSHDNPGYGHVYLRPLRDFVDSKTGKWIGGTKQKYIQWQGSTDDHVNNALREAGCPGKIGQRDYFYVNSAKYYLYQCNINADFDWKSWRIYLYSVELNQAKDTKLEFDQDIDIANPHISLKSKQDNAYEFVMSYFLPSEGTFGASSRPGQVIITTQFTYP